MRWSNDTSTESINSDYKKVKYKMDCYILQTNNIKMEKDNELKKVGIKNRTCYYFDDIVKIEDFDFDNILLEEKSSENILIYDASYKILIDARLLRILFDKVDRFIRDYNGRKYSVLLGPEKWCYLW